MILPALEGQEEITIVAQNHSGFHPPPDLSNIRPIKRANRNAAGKEFVWKVLPLQEGGPKIVGREKKVDAEVRVDEDISHLSRRRQRARVKKVTEAVLKLKGGLKFSKELEEIASMAPVR
jgi:hypothetical protein